MSEAATFSEKLAAVEKFFRETAELRQQIIKLRNLQIQHERELAELHIEEKKLRTFLMKIPQRVFVKDNNSVYISCNENYAADLKIRPEEIRGKTDFDFFPQDLAEKYRSDDKRMIQSGQSDDCEENYIVDGRKAVIRLLKNPIRDESGAISGIAGLFWDITEQKDREEAWMKERREFEEVLLSRTFELERIGEELKRERENADRKLEDLREKFAAVVDAAHSGIQVIQDGIVKFSNSKSREIFGLSQTELASKPVAEFIFPENRERFILHLERVKKFGAAHFFFSKIVQKDGKVNWLENRVSSTNWEGKPAILNLFIDQRFIEL